MFKNTSALSAIKLGALPIAAFDEGRWLRNATACVSPQQRHFMQTERREIFWRPTDRASN